MSWVDELVQEYEYGRKTLTREYNGMNSKNPNRKIVGGMIRDMEFVIEWLKTGRMPGKIKGIDLKGVYQINTYESKKGFPYGVTGYWDESVNAFVAKNSYTDPFQEVEDKIDREMELNKRA
ncbi:hypothetical protein ACDI16_12455 [Oceanobacillus caeni]